MQKLYMIGNTHFDPVWLWRWDEAMASIRATFRSALERMKEDENFIYSFAAPPVFEWIKKTDPDMFCEIKERIKEGRWDICEGWWVQPACYGASGESYARHSLYGQKYLFENFNKFSDCVFNIDSFGHNPAIPQILKKSHMKYYCFVRPEAHHMPLKNQQFIWRGLDGSEINAFRAEDAYSKEGIAKCLENQSDKTNDLIMVYGVTDHGGAPTKKMIKEINENENALFSSVSGFFLSHPSPKDTVSGELLTGDFGVYSNLPRVKKLNRTAEYAVSNAERASLIINSYDRDTLSRCWEDILFNQFHDILGGACIKAAYTDTENAYGRAAASANEIMHFALQRYSKDIKTVGENPECIWNLIVWNLNGMPYSGYIETEVQWAHEFDWYDKGIALEDSEGNIYECAVIPSKAVIPRFRSRFVFKADIPSCGYKTYKVIRTNTDDKKYTPDIYSFETDKLKIRFSKETGVLSAVYDKLTGSLIASDILRPAAFFDDGDTWAFNISGYDEKREDFSLSDIRLTEANDIRTVVRVTYRFKASVLKMYYTFYKKERYFDVRYSVNWNEEHYVLKLLGNKGQNAHTASVPFGSCKRGESRADMPCDEWIEHDGITYISDSIFSYNMIGGVLGLTVLRSPIYGDLRMGDISYDDDYDILSLGISEGAVRIDPDNDHSSSAGFNNPPVVICEANHGGSRAPEGSFFGCTGGMITAIKKCEFDDDTVIRLYENEGIRQTSLLKIGDKEFPLALEPFEIKTLKFDGDNIKEILITEDE